MNSFAWHFLCHKRNFEYLSLKQFHIFLLSCTVQYQRQSLTQVTVTYKLIIEAQVQTQSKYIVCYSYLVATFSLLTTYISSVCVILFKFFPRCSVFYIKGVSLLNIHSARCSVPFNFSDKSSQVDGMSKKIFNKTKSRFSIRIQILIAKC